MSDAGIQRVLYGAGEIRQRVGELAGDVSRHYGGREITVVGVLTGAFVFVADLVRRIDGPMRFSFLRAVSYRGVRSNRQPRLTPVSGFNVADKDVLIVEDIVDTGHSLLAVIEHVRRCEPASVTTVTLLDKRECRDPGIDIVADFTGFVAPSEFLVGYGLDYDGLYRNLPYVGVLDPSVYSGQT